MKDKLKGVVIAVAAIAALGVGGAAIAGAAGGGGDDDGNDKAITGPALDQASAAALKATGGGKVTETEVSDEESYYEVEVTRADGSQVDVQLDRGFHVVGQKADHEDAAARRATSDAPARDRSRLRPGPRSRPRAARRPPAAPTRPASPRASTTPTCRWRRAAAGSTARRPPTGPRSASW